MRIPWWLGLVGCAGDAQVDDRIDADADADSDSDSDADTDTDTDAHSGWLAHSAETGTTSGCVDGELREGIGVSDDTSGASDDFAPVGCAGSSSGEDVAWAFTASTAGRYVFDSEGTVSDVVLYALDGCAGDELACVDRFGPGAAEDEALVLDLRSGQRVVVVVDGADGAASYALVANRIPDHELSCTDGGDDDLDLVTDCDDPDCAAVAACLESVCDDGLDDDGNGLADCLDPDCATAIHCAPVCPDLSRSEVGPIAGTTVGAPDSGTGSCVPGTASPDVSIAFTAPRDAAYGFALSATHPASLVVLDRCGGAELACDAAGGDLVLDLTRGQTVVVVVDGVDGSAGPVTLSVFEHREDTAASCTDHLDNDGDGLVDCQEHACELLPVCEELCDNGLDDDGDFAMDCRDPTCAAFPACVETVCDDGLDDDANLWIDCADTDCRTFPGCFEICDDGLENDGDFRTDCQDSDCHGTPSCVEVCGNGLDDDGDYAVDCLDTACAAEPGCVETACGNGADDDGDYAVDCFDRDCDDSPRCAEVCDDGLDNDGDVYADCADPGCDGDPACLERCNDGIDNDGNYLVDCYDPDCSVAPACAEVCDDGIDSDFDNLFDCLDPDCELDLACAEICDDGEDDDRDGKVDCLDPVCVGDAACLRGCPEVELGNAPIVFAGDTYGAPDDFTAPCGFDPAPFSSASDVAHRFTAPATGDYLFDTRGTSFRAVLTVLDGDCAGPGLACESGAFTDNPFLVLPLSAGQSVIVVVDGTDYAQDGPYLLAVSGP